MTELRQLRFSYGKQAVLDGLTCSVQPGECLVLAGPNGSGKSTTLSLIAGVLRPKSGQVIPGGKVGFVPQGTALFEDMRVEDNLRFFAGLAKFPVPEQLPFGLEHRLKERVGKLSGGLKKQVSIACALLGDPQVILLDEPCASLDIEYRGELTGLILRLKQAGRTVIYTGHEPMEFFPFCDQLLFLGKHPTLYSREALAGRPADPTRFCDRYVQLFQTHTTERSD